MIQKPNYTQIPNVYFDEIMSTLNGSENLVFLAIMRKTFGWRKKKDRISYSQIMKMTGIAKSTTATTIKSLEEKGLIISEKHGQSVTYYVNVEAKTVPKIVPVRKSDCTENRTGTVPKIVPVEAKTVPKIGHTKEKDINKLSKEIYDEIEKSYELSFFEVKPAGKLFIDYPRTRKRIKELLKRISKEDIIGVIEKAKADAWIKDNGFQLTTILSDFQVSKLLNGNPARQGCYSKPLPVQTRTAYLDMED